VKIAKEMQKARERGEALQMSEEEIAFYDALAAHETAREVMGDDTLRTIARELVETIRENVNIDWTLKESVRARLRASVKRLLRKHGYPPDKREAATELVIQQAEVLCKDWPTGVSP
jgi:type I restriction enzyme, R subunit